MKSISILLVLVCVSFAQAKSPDVEPVDAPVVERTDPTVTAPVVVPKAKELIRPVAHTVHTVKVPSPDRGWFSWGTILESDELETLAKLYDGYQHKSIAERDVKRISQMMRLLSTGAGKQDEELAKLFYFTVFQVGTAHPVKGYLERKTKFKFEELTENSAEYAKFESGMQAVAERYGLE